MQTVIRIELTALIRNSWLEMKHKKTSLKCLILSYFVHSKHCCRDQWRQTYWADH